MALNKREYTDQETVITAENLNDIQDEIIANAAAISSQSSQIATIRAVTDRFYTYAEGDLCEE